MEEKEYIRTPEQRQRIGDALRGKPKSEEHKAALRGKKHKPFVRTEEHKRRIAEALRGKVKSQEHRDKISETKTGVPIHSEEAKAKMADGRRRGENSPMHGYQWSDEQRAYFRGVHTGHTSLLESYGISRQEYANQITSGNRWCMHRKHFDLAENFDSKKRPVCNGCKAEYNRELSLRGNFGVDHDWYLAKLAEQGGGCAICGTTVTNTRGKKHLAIDHNHATGTVRGVLCARCNQSLERVESIPNWCALATAYLVRYAIPNLEGVP